MNSIVYYATRSCMLIALVTLPLTGSVRAEAEQEPAPDGEKNVVRSDLGEAEYSSADIERAIQQRLTESAVVAMDMSDIPDENLRDAHCIGVIPAALEGAFLIGYQYGRGVMTCRQSSTSNPPEGLGGPPDRDVRAWSNPSMMAMDAVSIGLQVGATSTDIIVLLMTPSALDTFLEGDLRFDTVARATADLDAADAPDRVGGVDDAGDKDIVDDAGVLTYGRTGGLFAGIALSGASLRPDDGANEALYEREIEARDLVSGSAPETTPLIAVPFTEAIQSAAGAAGTAR